MKVLTVLRTATTVLRRALDSVHPIHASAGSNWERTDQEGPMMGDTRNSIKDEERRKRAESTRDPEFEMPDEEEVERDRERAERLYREDQKKKPAA